MIVPFEAVSRKSTGKPRVATRGENIIGSGGMRVTPCATPMIVQSEVTLAAP